MSVAQKSAFWITALLGVGVSRLFADPTQPQLTQQPTPLTLTRPDRVLQQGLDTKSTVYQVEYSPDEKMLAATLFRWNAPQHNRAMRLWTLATGQVQRTVIGGYLAAFSPDSRKVAVGCFDGTVKVWSTSSNAPPVILRASGGVSNLTFSPDGSLLAMTIDEHDVYMELWDVAKSQCLIGLSAPKSSRFHVTDVTALYFAGFSPDGKLLQTVDTSGAQWWDITSGRRMPIPKFWAAAANPFRQKLSPDRKVLAYLEFAPNGYPEDIVLRKEATGEKIGSLHYPHLKEFRCSNDVSFEFSPDSRKLAVIWQPTISSDAFGAVQLWDLANSRLIATWQDKDFGPPVPIVQFTPDSKFLTLRGGYGLNLLKVRDADTGKLVRTLQGKSQDFTSVDIAPDGQMLAAGGADGMVRLWRIR